MKRLALALMMALCHCGADDCNGDDLTERAPPGEDGVDRQGRAYHNPVGPSEPTGPRVKSVTVGTGGVNVEVAP